MQQDPCWMLQSQHAQCNKITCCTLLHIVAQGMLLMTISKVDLYIQFYIQRDPYVDLVASGKLHTVISVVYCCIVHGTERLGLMNQLPKVNLVMSFLVNPNNPKSIKIQPRVWTWCWWIQYCTQHVQPNELSMVPCVPNPSNSTGILDRV